MDEIRYCEYKILLKPERFATPEDFSDFWHRVVGVAARCGVEIRSGIDDTTPAIRYVTFYDTPGSDLYGNAFILRERVGPERGASAEITFKFRHADRVRAGNVDVRAHTSSKTDVRFKEEVLQPRDRDGAAGARSVYSHNCVLRGAGLAPPSRMDALVALFPALSVLEVTADAPIAIVNGKTIEERQVETGLFDFGRGLTAKSSVAIWQDRETGAPVTGEFSYQTKFESLATLDERARDRADHLHFKLQRLLVGWVATGATKTSLIYDKGVGRE